MKKNKKKFCLRSKLFAFGAILSVLMFFLPSPRAETKKTLENTNDIIIKAQNLVLQKERPQAIATLVAALRREPKSGRAYGQLKQTLSDLSTRFLSDKTQQHFENALTLKWNDPQQSQRQLDEALRAEPENTLLQAEMVRSKLEKEECEGALEAAEKFIKDNPFDEMLMFLKARAHVCRKEWPEYAATRALSDFKKGTLSKNWQILEMERALLEKAEARAHELFQLIRTYDLPDVEYYAFSLAKSEELKTRHAQNYLLKCKDLTSADKRKLTLLGSFCGKTKPIEEYLKKKGATIL